MNLWIQDIDVFELHDAFSIMAVLSLEACGFADRGQGVRLGLDDDIGVGGKVPICTRGGLKARGHPVGATGTAQLYEVWKQLRGTAGERQIPNKNLRLGAAHNVGGHGGTCTFTILERR